MTNHKQNITEIEDMHQTGNSHHLEETFNYFEQEINEGNQIILVRRPENAPEETVDVIRSIQDLNRYREKYLS